jgi:capsid protein
MIDPQKEIAASKDEVRAGFKSLAESIREKGNDPEVTFKEIAETNKTLDKLGIKLDTDPRYVTEFGQEQPSVYASGASKSDKSKDSNSTDSQGESQ